MRDLVREMDATFSNSFQTAYPMQATHRKALP